MRFHINATLFSVVVFAITYAAPPPSEIRCPPYPGIHCEPCPRIPCPPCPRIPCPPCLGIHCKPCPRFPFPFPHLTQSVFNLKDLDAKKLVTVPNGYSFGKNYGIKDPWDGAFYASYSTLPSLLKQYNFKGSEEAITNLTLRGAPLFADLVLGAVFHSNSTDGGGGHLSRRDIFGDIAGWFEDAFGTVACGAFAAGADPGFAAAAGIFDVINPSGVGLTDDQLFFIYAGLGYVPDGITVVYNANFAPGFGAASGVTFLKSIYARPSGGPDTVSTSGLDQGFTDQFMYLTTLLTHESWHVRQYESHGYDLASFGFDYLYSYCRKGFSYTDNQYEVDARAVASTIAPLFGGTNAYFFKVWKLHNLKGVLGYPQSTDVYFSTYLPTKEQIISLSFQNGILEIRPSSKLYRTWTGADLGKKIAASCNPNQINHIICNYKTSRTCHPQNFKEQNARCRAAIAAYKLINSSLAWIKI